MKYNTVAAVVITALHWPLAHGGTTYLDVKQTMHSYAELEFECGATGTSSNLQCGLKHLRVTQLPYETTARGTCTSPNGRTPYVFNGVVDASTWGSGCAIGLMNPATHQKELKGKLLVKYASTGGSKLPDLAQSLYAYTNDVSQEIWIKARVVYPDGTTHSINETNRQQRMVASPYYSVPDSAWVAPGGVEQRITLQYPDFVRISAGSDINLLETTGVVSVTATTDLQNVDLVNESGDSLNQGTTQHVRKRVIMRTQGAAKGVTEGAVTLNVAVK